jgi:hypothetical protein
MQAGIPVELLNASSDYAVEYPHHMMESEKLRVS